MKIKNSVLLALVTAGSLLAATASASSVTFNLSEGSNAGPVGQVFSYHVYINGAHVCSIGWNANSCSGTVVGSGSPPGLAKKRVEVFWVETNSAGNSRHIINKLSFWTAFASGSNIVNIPTSAVTFTLTGGSPWPDIWLYYLRSSDEVSANGPMTMPSSKNGGVSHKVAITQYNKYSVTQPVLAGCYTVAVRENTASDGTNAFLGSLTDNKVLCVGDNTPATVDFDFTSKHISITTGP